MITEWIHRILPVPRKRYDEQEVALQDEKRKGEAKSEEIKRQQKYIRDLEREIEEAFGDAISGQFEAHADTSVNKHLQLRTVRVSLFPVRAAVDMSPTKPIENIPGDKLLAVLERGWWKRLKPNLVEALRQMVMETE